MKENEKEYIITICPICHCISEVAVNEEDFWIWAEGACVQDAFPYLSADDRERLISGICPDCWKKMFSSNDEVEDEEFEPDKDFEPDYNLDEGFDPYAGEYTWDC